MQNTSDMEIVQLLIERDEKTTRDFFYVRCHNLFMSIIRNIFSHPVDEVECISVLYLYLMENDAARIRQFEGKSTLLQWLKITAIRFFIRHKEEFIGDMSGEQEMPIPSECDDTGTRIAARLDVERLLAMMTNQRYVFVIRRLILEEATPDEVADELNVKVSNLYNLKKRAMEALTYVALKDKRKYGTRYL